jgi:hypothetical protein
LHFSPSRPSVRFSDDSEPESVMMLGIDHPHGQRTPRQRIMVVFVAASAA